jgi:hypothetical protein
MIPPGEENNPSAWPTNTLGNIVAREVGLLATAEGRASRVSDEDADKLGKIVGVAGGAATGLDPLGKGLAGFGIAKSAKTLLKKIPAPLVVVVAVITVNGSIMWAMVNADIIIEIVEQEWNALLTQLQKFASIIF